MATLKAPITPLDHRLGPRDAPVVLVEYGDYQCPHCAAAQQAVGELLRHFSGDLALIFRHFPLTEVHPLAETAAQTAEFAGQHGVFWPMHRALFANQPALSLPTIFALAGALDLSKPELQEALASGTHARKVREDFMGGVLSGVNGTPTFFVNGVRHDAGYSFGELAASVDGALQTAAAPRKQAN